MGTTSQRKSNIELLRIVAMLLIVAHHFVLHGGFAFSTEEITVNRLWIQFWQMGGKAGVNLFVLISGYFLIRSNFVKINRVLKMYWQIFLYSLPLFLLFVAVGLESFSVKEALRSAFPVTLGRWWFASAYFVLYLISPFLNRLLTSLNKPDYRKLLLLTTVCWSLVPTLTDNSFQSNELVWFMYLYAVAGYIRLHTDLAGISGKKAFSAALIFFALTYLSVLTFDLIGLWIPFVGQRATFFYGMQKLPILIISISLFLGFLKTNIRHSAAINTLSATMFGVYLIHEHPCVRTFLWKTLFRCASFSDSPYLIPYSIAVILCVFILCALIEFFRIRVLERPLLKTIDKISDWIQRGIDRLFKWKIFRSEEDL